MLPSVDPIALKPVQLHDTAQGAHWRVASLNGQQLGVVLCDFAGCTVRGRPSQRSLLLLLSAAQINVLLVVALLRVDILNGDGWVPQPPAVGVGAAMLQGFVPMSTIPG